MDVLASAEIEQHLKSHPALAAEIAGHLRRITLEEVAILKALAASLRESLVRAAPSRP